MAQSGLPTMEQALKNPLDRTNIMGLNSHFPRGFWDFSGAVAANVIICRMRCSHLSSHLALASGKCCYLTIVGYGFRMIAIRR